MFFNYLEQMSSIYDNLDSILITNREGIIEYSAIIDKDNNTVQNEGFTGRHLMDVYPVLTEKESTIFRVMKSGEPIMDEIQTLTDINGRTLTFSCCTYPIGLGDKVIGAIEGVIILSEDGKPCSKAIKKRHNYLKKGDRLYCLDDMVTADSAMIRIKEQIKRAAAGNSPVMITGETGTGKEIAAQSIHSHSSRSEGPFVSQNCSAIPMGLLESILFGTVKGSYTGAENRKGLFELAHKGTLFLDELNSMEISLQGKILKAVEEQKIRRVGDERERNIDVRIVSAVNREPKDLIDSGEMRSDLFYRLGVVQISLPLLKERKNDIPLLVDYYIDYYNKLGTKKIDKCSELALKMFITHNWPGNVRELKNAVEYAFNMAKSREITMHDIPTHIINYRKNGSEASDIGMGGIAKQIEFDGSSLTEQVEKYEKGIIMKVYNDSPNITAAADKLKLSRQALSYKMKKYGIL